MSPIGAAKEPLLTFGGGVWVESRHGTTFEDHGRGLGVSRAESGECPGSEAWVDRMTKRFDLESAFRPRGRPCKESPNNGP